MRQGLPLDPSLPLGPAIEVAGVVLVPPMGPEKPQPCGVFADGQFLTQSLCYGGDAEHPITVEPAFAGPVRHMAGRYLFGGVLSGHFGHMLVEGSGRLWALHGRTDVDGVVFFARPFDKAKHCAKLFSQMAALLGLPPVTVLEEPVSVDHLVLAEQGLGSGALMLGRPEARAYLRDRLALVEPEGAARKFYVTRTGQPARRGTVLGEASLEALFAAQGYEVIRPEEHLLARQVAMFRGASHVVGTEGSPFHLLAMAAQTGCKVAVIQRRRSPVFKQICQHLEVFIGGAVLGLDQLDTIYAPKRIRNVNYVYLEPDRPAIWAALSAAGFVGGDPWVNMTADERRAELKRLRKETTKTLRPVAVEDLPEDDGDQEKDAA